MKKNKFFIRNKGLQFILVLLLGLFLGWLIFGGSNTHNHSEGISTSEDVGTVWTCSMHPQIRSEKPGKCPLCGMDLTPLPSGGNDAIDESAIQMSKEAIALANIQTTVVGSQQAVRDMNLYGTVQIDERLQHSQTSHVNGRIEELYVNFTGEAIRNGQAIAKIYSPDLMTAQQELLEAVKLQELQPALLEAAKIKLQLWKMTEEQITNVLDTKTVSPYVKIYSNTNGIVIDKNVNQGDYINQGTVLYTIANLSRLWVVFDAYESELPFLKVGDPIEYSLQSLPDQTFNGRISFINPIVDPVSRTAKIRVEVANNRNLLKPEMYATATISTSLKSIGNNIVVPKSAVLWTGKRSIVYVKNPNTSTPAFNMREIDLGASLGESYMVIAGLENGEEVVTNGAYVIDASAQLEGKASMMNEVEEDSSHDGHEAHNHNHQHVEGESDDSRADHIHNLEHRRRNK